jgi:acyl-CoA reductase-like NAD-dependent aldehyde dehydrogenase
VVFKASELCPRLHQLLVKIFNEAGLPDGVINVIQASRERATEVTETAIAHPAIRKAEFVGSASVGRIIGQLCAKYLKPIFMELGGKGPAIVLDDADLEAAAKKCVLGCKFLCPVFSFMSESVPN